MFEINSAIVMQLQCTTPQGARDLSQLANYKQSGVVHVLEKKRFRRSKWQSRYLVICKGHNGTWNLVCYLDHLANKAEVIYSMLELERVKEYSNAAEKIIGFSIKFEKPLAPLIFSCDTRDSQMIWIEKIRCAINDAHKFSADSAYESGESIRDSLSKAYSSIDDSHIEESESKRTRDTDPQESTSAKSALNKPTKDIDFFAEDFEENIDGVYELARVQSYENINAEPYILYGMAKGLNAQRRNSIKNETFQDVDKSEVAESSDEKTIENKNSPEQTVKMNRKPVENTEQHYENAHITGPCYKATDIRRNQFERADEMGKSTVAATSAEKITIENKNNANQTMNMNRKPVENTEQHYENFTGPYYKAANIKRNQFQGTPGDFTKVNTCTSIEYLKSHIQSTCDEDSRKDNTDVKMVEQDNRKMQGQNDSMLQETRRKVVSEIKTKCLKDPASSDNIGSIFSHHSPTSVAKYEFPLSTKRLPIATGDSTQTETDRSCSFISTRLGQNDDSEESATSSFVSVRGLSSSKSLYRQAPVNVHSHIQEGTIEVRNNGISRESTSHVNDIRIISSRSYERRDSDFWNNYENPDENAEPEQVFERQDYYCAEKKDVKRIMMNTFCNGTFLVSPGKETREELAVKTPAGLKYFRIYERDEKYSLFKEARWLSFISMDGLLFYYYLNNLPSNEYEVKLTRGYKKKSD